MSFDCSYKFEDFEEAKKYKYVVITYGDLDLNGAFMLRSKKDLNAYLKEADDRIYAIISVKQFLQFRKLPNGGLTIL